MFRRSLLIAACALQIVGCVNTVQQATLGGIDYPYGPSSLHLHSLSRLELSPESLPSAAFVFVQFDDIDRQTTRATGVLEVAIVLPDRTKIEQSINLNNLGTNDENWDRTVRMYRIDFEFVPPLAEVPESGLPVSVTWTPVDGKASTVRGVLRGPHRP